MKVKREYLILFLFIIICFLFRCYELNQKNYWLDEVISWHVSNLSLKDLIVFNMADIHPPFYYIVLKFWIMLFGDSAISMRMMSVLFCSMSIIFIYFLSRYFLPNYFTYLIIFLYIISPLNIYFAQEARMYALNLFLNLGAVYYYIKILFSENKWKNYFYFVFYTVLALYTHYFSFLFLCSFVIIILIYRKMLIMRKIFLSILIIFLLYIPWLPILMKQFLSGQNWRRPLSFMEVLDHGMVFYKSIVLSPYFYLSSSLLSYLLDYFFVILNLLVLIIIIKKHYESKQSAMMLNIIIIITLFPVLLSLIHSFRQNIDLSRYLSILVPFIIIFYVYVLSYFKKAIVIFLIFIIPLNLYGDIIYFSQDVKYNDYRKIIEFIKNNTNQNIKIYVEPDYCGWIVNFYLKEYSLNYPNANESKIIIDSLKSEIKKIGLKEFIYIQDYRVPDTSNYSKNLKNLSIDYNLKLQKEFPIEHAHVNVFIFDIH